ncbi:MAG: PIN domain-containing protein [Prevotellaceae bacterium]|jgi:predicted nucleic acid-binding protein|nr:PIN domain-containing protein [Prevotellaceae bacterium]
MRQIITTKPKRIAVDTNIFVYLRDNNTEKKMQAIEVIKLMPVVSAQVVSEYLNVIKRLFKLPKQQILEICMNDLKGCHIQQITYYTLFLAKKLIEIYDFQLFDSIVVASALEAGCSTLYSEDMHSGLVVEKQLEIINPFL